MSKTLCAFSVCVFIVLCLGHIDGVECWSHSSNVHRRSVSIEREKPLPKIISSQNELILDKGNNLTLECEANEPITWSHEIDHMMDSSELKMEVDHRKGKKMRYASILHLIDLEYTDTKFYFCHYNDSHDRFDINKSASIYIYVRDDENLFAYQDDIRLLKGYQHRTLVIPCRPSSPDVHVVLLAGDSEADNEIGYDPKVGITITMDRLTDTGVYTCVGISRTGVRDTRTYVVHLMPKTENAPKPFINDSSTSPSHVVGESLQLSCYVVFDDSIAVDTNWIVPDPKGIESKRIRTNKDSWRNYEGLSRVLMINRLVIDSTTFNDSGTYTCMTNDHNENRNAASFDIKIIEQGTSYINLTESANQYVLNVNKSIGSVQWKVDIEAYPPVSVRWYDNKGMDIIPNGLEDSNPKYIVRGNTTETILKIMNVDVEDSGVYTLGAMNTYTQTFKNFTLHVSGKPTVDIQHIDDYHMINEPTQLVCHAIGYPPPNITWYFQPGLHGSSKTVQKFDKSQLEIRTFKDQEYRIESVLKITPKQSGDITCEAQNSIGHDFNTHRFFVTDVKKGCHVWYPNQEEPVAVGNDLTLICGASIYNFTDKFYWYYRNSSVTNEQIENKYQVVTYNTTYSYRSNLTIKNIKRYQSGTYECRNTDEHTTCNQVTIEVKDVKAPEIFKTNMNNSIVRKDIGRELTLTCYASGIPTPVISWKRNDKPWRPDKNSHIKLEDRNQLLRFTFTKYDDVGKYACGVSNRVGRVERFADIQLATADAKTNYALIGGILFLALVLLAIVIVLMMKIKKERKLRKELTIAGLMHFEEGAIESLNPELGVDDQAELLPYDKKWEFPREKLKLGKQLGSGAFGVVTKARAYGIEEQEEVTTVAVKMAKRNADFIYIKALASELKIMVHLGKHLNVVNLLGACTKNVTKRELFVIVEFCRFGNLHNYLMRHRENFIDQIDPTTGAIDTSIGSEILSRTLSVSTTYSEKTDMDSTSPLVPSGGADYRAECTNRRLNSSSSCTGEENVSMMPSGDDVMITSANTIQPEWRSNYHGDYNGKVRPISTQDLLCWAFQVAHGMEYLVSRRVLHGDLAARNILLADNNIVKICDFGLAKSMYKSDNYRKKGEGPLPVKWMAVESIRDRVFSTQSDVWSYGIVLWEFFSLARTPYPGMEADERFYNKLVDGYRMERPDYATKQIYQIMLECWNSRPVQRPSFTDLVVKIGSTLEDSVRRHYIDLNSPYLSMNDQVTQNGHSDYLSMLSAPDYGNLVSPTYVNNPTNHADDDDDDDDVHSVATGGETSGGYLCMRPTPAPAGVIFSPRKSNVFNFDQAVADVAPTPNGLSADTDQKQKPAITTSFSNPSYQYAPKIGVDDFNKENISGKDNYINVPKCKDAVAIGNDATEMKHYVNELKV